MSDEASIESAFRHVDVSRRLPWHGKAPDQAMIDAEEGPCIEDRRADAQEALMTYLFSGRESEWGDVARRLLAVMRLVLSGELSIRAPQEIPIRDGPYQSGNVAFALGDLQRLIDDDADTIRRLMLFLCPNGPQWLKEGCRRVYLVAMVFQPYLIKPRGGEVTFEHLAKVFGEIPVINATDEDRGRARARWSARGDSLLRKRIEHAGISIPALFGKGSEVRAKYQSSAKGNTNRKPKQ